jgi:hypothetical protein
MLVCSVRGIAALRKASTAETCETQKKKMIAFLLYRFAWRWLLSDWQPLGSKSWEGGVVGGSKGALVVSVTGSNHNNHAQ